MTSTIGVIGQHIPVAGYPPNRSKKEEIMNKKYTPIAVKLNLIIVITLLIGIGGISLFLGYTYLSGIEQKIRLNLVVQSDILYKAIEKYMLPGQASYAVEFFRDIATINPEYTIKLFRTTGVKAFSDNRTIEVVNTNRAKAGKDPFPLKKNVQSDPERPDQVHFDATLAKPPNDVFFTTIESHDTFFRMYKPLINLPKCTGCHGSDHTIRGVLDIRNNITRDIDDQRNRFIIMSLLFLFVVSALAFFITRFLRNAVIAPVKAIGDICTKVTTGIFSDRVSIKNNDEIGTLAETVNAMALGLHERYELSKFVSSKTLESLTLREKGQKATFALLFTDIRGFTAYSEKVTPEHVVENLNSLLGMQTDIIHRHGGDVDKYVGDEIVALFSGEDSILKSCKAAHEIQVEIEAKTADLYDGLHVGIGINAGEVILGMVGSEKRADFTVIGDNVNIASRLCDAAKPGQTLIHESVYNGLSGTAETEGPFRLKVKGKDAFLRVYLFKAFKGE
jgi:adenylate cyclase